MASVNWDALGGDLLDDVLSAEDTGPDFGDRYEVREILGQGGQGTVYRAWDRGLERDVAIKCLRDPGINQRPLLEESRLLSRLAHPAIPQVYDRGSSPNGGAYVVMQYIAGRRLDQALRRKDLQLADRLHLFRGVAGAVAHAHARGILHRDLKPENVMVTEAGEPYLVDWGLAANGGPRAICGSPYFAAPEQLEGQPADPRADIYALGVLLYVILSGELPYGRAVRSFDEFRRQRAALTRVPLRTRVPGTPPALERMCETAMAAQPGARYQRVEEMMADLVSVESGRPLARDLPRLPWRGIAAVLAVGLALGAGIAVGRLGAPAPEPTPSPVTSPLQSVAAPAADAPTPDAFDHLWSADPDAPRDRDASAASVAGNARQAGAPADEDQGRQEAIERVGELMADHQGDARSEPVARAEPDDPAEARVGARSEPVALPEPDAEATAIRVGRVDDAPSSAAIEEAPPPPLSDPLAELEALLPSLERGAPASEPEDWEALLPPLREPVAGHQEGGPENAGE